MKQSIQQNILPSERQGGVSSPELKHGASTPLRKVITPGTLVPCPHCENGRVFDPLTGGMEYCRTCGGTDTITLTQQAKLNAWDAGFGFPADGEPTFMCRP